MPAALVLVALGLCAFWLEPASLRTTSYTLTLEPGSGALDGLRIAVLADLHGIAVRDFSSGSTSVIHPDFDNSPFSTPAVQHARGSGVARVRTSPRDAGEHPSGGQVAETHGKAPGAILGSSPRIPA